MSADRKTNILVADDSLLFVEMLTEVLEADPALRVVAAASSGEQAVQMNAALRPDVITMDVRMPGMGGFAAVERIMGTRPAPILILTEDARATDRTWAFEGLRRGALDLWAKPVLTNEFAVHHRKLRDHLKLLATVPVVHHVFRPESDIVHEVEPRSMGSRLSGGVVGIVGSTGGPSVLADILGALPASFPLGIVIVQHLATGFAEHLVAWLSDICALDVRLGTPGARIRPGTVWVAPDGCHMVVRDDGTLDLDRLTLATDGHRPSGTMLLRSLARVFGATAIGVVLTGMGSDGAAGLLDLLKSGGRTVAQDAETSVVDGMPGAARSLGAAERSVPRDELAKEICRLASLRMNASANCSGGEAAL